MKQELWQIRLCANAPIAVKLCKDAINRGMQVDIDKAINIEAEDFGSALIHKIKKKE